jgi:hypothetical protein
MNHGNEYSYTAHPTSFQLGEEFGVQLSEGIPPSGYKGLLGGDTSDRIVALPKEQQPELTWEEYGRRLQEQVKKDTSHVLVSSELLPDQLDFDKPEYPMPEVIVEDTAAPILAIIDELRARDNTSTEDSEPNPSIAEGYHEAPVVVPTSRATHDEAASYQDTSLETAGFDEEAFTNEWAARVEPRIGDVEEASKWEAPEASSAVNEEEVPAVWPDGDDTDWGASDTTSTVVSEEYAGSSGTISYEEPVEPEVMPSSLSSSLVSQSIAPATTPPVMDPLPKKADRRAPAKNSSPEKVEEIKRSYKAAFETAAKLMAEQEMGFKGGKVGKIEQFVYDATRWMGHTGDDIYGFLYGTRDLLRIEREETLDILQKRLIEYAVAEKSTPEERLDLIQGQQDDFAQRVLKIKEAHAEQARQRGGFVRAALSTKWVVTASMTALGAAVGVASALLGNPEGAFNAATFSYSLQMAALSGLAGIFGGDRAARAAVLTKSSILRNEEWVKERGLHQAQRQAPLNGQYVTQEDVELAAENAVNLMDTRIERVIAENDKDLWHSRALGFLVMANATLISFDATVFAQYLAGHSVVHQTTVAMPDHHTATQVPTHTPPHPTPHATPVVHQPTPTPQPTHTPPPQPTAPTPPHAGHDTPTVWHHQNVNPSEAKSHWIWDFVSKWAKNPDQFIRHGLELFNKQHPGANYQYVQQTNGSWWVMYKGKDGLMHALNYQQELSLKDFLYKL